jgi:hypothetical protein
MRSTDRKGAALTSSAAVGRSLEKIGPEASGARAEKSHGGEGGARGTEHCAGGEASGEGSK